MTRGFNSGNKLPIWMHAGLSATMSGMLVNSQIVFDEVHAQSNGGISLNALTGVFTLPAGHVFKLNCAIMSWNFSLANGLAWYEWVLDDNSSMQWSKRAVLRPMSATSQHSMQPNAAVIVSTQEETNVKLRCVGSDGTHEISEIGTFVHISELV